MIGDVYNKFKVKILQFVYNDSYRFYDCSYYKVRAESGEFLEIGVYGWDICPCDVGNWFEIQYNPPEDDPAYEYSVIGKVPEPEKLLWEEPTKNWPKDGF